MYSFYIYCSSSVCHVLHCIVWIKINILYGIQYEWAVPKTLVRQYGPNITLITANKRINTCHIAVFRQVRWSLCHNAVSSWWKCLPNFKYFTVTSCENWYDNTAIVNTASLCRRCVRGLRNSDWQSMGSRFDSQPFHFPITSLSTLFAHMCVHHKAV